MHENQLDFNGFEEEREEQSFGKSLLNFQHIIESLDSHGLFELVRFCSAIELKVGSLNDERCLIFAHELPRKSINPFEDTELIIGQDEIDKQLTLAVEIIKNALISGLRREKNQAVEEQANKMISLFLESINEVFDRKIK